MGLHYNEYVKINTLDETQCCCRFNGSRLVPLPASPRIRSVRAKPNNLEQKIFLDLLGDSSVELITAVGPAGSGKTFLTTAAALEQMNNGLYDKVVIIKPMVNVGRDIGALPGTKHEKLEPWMACSIDTINSLPGMDCDKLIEEDKLEFEAINFLRGQSMPNQFIIIEDAQNLTAKQATTIVTRCGEGTKIVLLGDISDNQIDKQHLDPINNGLAFVITKMYGKDPSIAHITLEKTVRSHIADLAVRYLTGE